MVPTLPNELIFKIAEYLIEPDLYVIYKHQPSNDYYGSLQNSDFATLLRPESRFSKLQSPLALALFSPALLVEYSKLLHEKAVFYFYRCSYLYYYINPPPGAISESVLRVRRSIRFIRICRWECWKREEKEGPSAVCHNCVPWRPCRGPVNDFDWECSSLTSFDYAISLLPKAKSMHIDSWDSITDRRGKSRLDLIVRDLLPLFERTTDPMNVLTIGYFGFGVPMCYRRSPMKEDEQNRYRKRLLKEIELIKRGEM